MIGNITLDGRLFRVDVQSWRDKDIIDFAPRATVPGGSTVMSDLGLYQPLVQTDWQHGFGFHWYTNAQGYLHTIGNVDTRQDGLVMMMTKATSSDTNNNIKEGFVVFNDVLYAYGAAGLRKFSGGVWSSVYSTTAVNHAINAGDYMLIAPDGARVLKMDTSETITNAGLDASSTDYRWLVIHNGFIYAGKDGTNRIHYDDNPDLSQLEGTTADPNIIYCGIGNVPTLRPFVFATNLYVAREDGLWHIGEDRIARRALDFSDESSDANFRSIAEINGFLVFPIRDRVVQWNTARVADLTPQKITDTYPYVTYGRFDNFVSHDNFMFCTARTNQGTYEEHLICWDGVAWHKLMELVTNGTDTVTAMGYDVVNNRLWYHVDATADATYYIPFQNNSSFPYADFPTTGTHSLVTSRLEMGFRRIKKSAASLIMETRNCDDERYISVYYQLDGSGNWYLWEHVRDNGIIELKNPSGLKTLEFHYMNLRFDFVTDGADQTPILEGYTLRFIMRPNVLWGVSFNVLAGTDIQEGNQEDDRTAAEIRREIFDIRNSKKPVTLIDLFGDEHHGYITSVQGTTRMVTYEDDEENPDIETSILVNFAALSNSYEE